MAIEWKAHRHRLWRFCQNRPIVGAATIISALTGLFSIGFLVAPYADLGYVVARIEHMLGFHVSAIHRLSEAGEMSEPRRILLHSALETYLQRISETAARSVAMSTCELTIDSKFFAEHERFRKSVARLSAGSERVSDSLRSLMSRYHSFFVALIPPCFSDNRASLERMYSLVLEHYLEEEQAAPASHKPLSWFVHVTRIALTATHPSDHQRRTAIAESFVEKFPRVLAEPAAASMLENVAVDYGWALQSDATDAYRLAIVNRLLDSRWAGTLWRFYTVDEANDLRRRAARLKLDECRSTYRRNTEKVFNECVVMAATIAPPSPAIRLDYKKNHNSESDVEKLTRELASAINTGRYDEAETRAHLLPPEAILLSDLKMARQLGVVLHRGPGIGGPGTKMEREERQQAMSFARRSIDYTRPVLAEIMVKAGVSAGVAVQCVREWSLTRRTSQQCANKLVTAERE